MTRELSLRRKQFSAHKADAKRRGVAFLLTFDEWLAVWQASGHLQQRGRGRGQYVMARHDDRGPYAVGNVRVILASLSQRRRGR